MNQAVKIQQENIQRVIDGRNLSPDMARDIWLMMGTLFQTVREAETSAFFAMREIQSGQVQSAEDFHKGTLKILGDVKQQLIFLRSVIDGKK